MRISVYSSRELLAVIAGMRTFDKEARKEIRQRTRPMIEPEWKQGVAERAETRLEHRVLVSSARVRVSDQNVTLRSAGSTRRLSGGLQPSSGWPVVEFGVDRDGTRTYEAERNGLRYTVRNRHTRRQLRPRRSKGYVVYPAAAELIPRLASLWVQTWVRTFHEVLERR